MYDPYKITITDRMREDAKIRHLHYGDAFTNHEIEGGKGRIWGSLGEIVAGSVMKGCTEALTFNYDLIWKDQTWDIKTKTRRDVPLSYWDASIAASAMHQKTDYYVFISIIAKQNLLNEPEEVVLNFPYEEAYILGYISKNDFLLKSTLQKAGKTDTLNGLVYRMDTLTLPYSELTPFGTLLDESTSEKDSRTKSSSGASTANRPKLFQRFRQAYQQQRGKASHPRI